MINEHNHIDTLYNLIEDDDFPSFYKTLQTVSAKSLLEYEPKRDNTDGNIFNFILDKNKDYFNCLFNHIITEEMKNKQKVINLTATNRWSLLMDACVFGKMQKVSTLIHLGADINHKSNAIGLFPNAIHTCINKLNNRQYNTHLDILKYLIYKKAELNVVDFIRGNEITAFALQFLSAPVKKNKDNTTEVKFYKFFDEVITTLVTNGVNINFKNHLGTIGHIMCHQTQYSQYELKKLMNILIHNGYDVAIKDNDQKTCAEKLPSHYQKNLGVYISQYGNIFKEQSLLNQDMDTQHNKPPTKTMKI